MSHVADRGRGALLLIDFQNDFLALDGRLPVNPAQVEPLLAASQRLVAKAEADEDLIVKIGSEFRPSDVIGNLFRHRAAIRGGNGTAWDERIDPQGAIYLPKWRSDAFCNPDLAALLAEHHVTKVRLAGLFAKACVTATAKGARKRGLSVQVIGDATACSSDRSRKAALDKLRSLGVDVI